MEWIEIQIPVKRDICCKQCQNVLSETTHIDIYSEIEGKQKIAFLLFIQESKLDRSAFIPKKINLSNSPPTFLMYLQNIHCAFCQSEVGILFRTANIQNRFALGKTALYFKKIVFSHADEQKCLQSLSLQLRQRRSMGQKDFPSKSDISRYTHKQIQKNIFEAYERLEQRGKQLLKKAIQITKQSAL